MRVWRGVVLLLCLLVHGAAWAEAAPPAITGGRFHYTVQPGDHLEKIGARFGVAAPVLARDNALKNPDRIRPGQTLWVDNRHIVPATLPDGILINIPQRMLFLFEGGALAAAHPVGLGRPTWPTVEGSFHVAALEENPVWDVPRSIQEEMAREGEIVRNKVPPGPDNPLGQFWIGLSAAGYGIHGTIAPGSIYQFRSHGCIRLHPDDIARLFPRLKRGLPVLFLYLPVLVAEADGRTFVEVHPDVYGRGIAPEGVVQKLSTERQLTDKIDDQLAREVIRAREGTARDVTREQLEGSP